MVTANPDAFSASAHTVDMSGEHKFKTLDANEAVASIAYRLNEVIALYPITPSSPMGEWCDQWASEGVPNIWGTVPHVIEMQSEGDRLENGVERGANDSCARSSIRK